MGFHIDIACQSLNKAGEELNGDRVEILKNANSTVVVLADGLGSGVKANILSTLTTKIIGTMISRGLTIDEAVETIINTLPSCKNRGIAYSTFSILQIFNSGEVYLVEFDNPSMFCFRKRKPLSLEKEKRAILDKVIYETRFKLNIEDTFVLASDGVIHAGVGKTLNLGWQWENIQEYIQNNCLGEMSAKSMTKQLLTVCDNLYKQKPGDDSTVAVIKIKPVIKVCILACPPENKYDDKTVVKRFICEDGRKIICGGTTAQIVARELGLEVITDFNYASRDIPPVAKIQGINMVTEGIVTLKKVLQNIKEYATEDNRAKDFLNLIGNDAASVLTRTLLEEATHIHFFVGKGANAFSLEAELEFKKLDGLEEIAQYLISLGKEVEIEYY